ncbi:MAG: DegT/DnrJ/EryC1/StrS family aminotransferase [Pseudorhodoplanes sp.]|jgi:dTDP-4-amino-4,6-dideoxygalactose transaminase|nr:DegT/DnrJ/EryC1/StrS family aminotransferase [Pseudorhodoplanes sp.]
MSNSSTLALLGGTPVNPTQFPPYNTIGVEEKAAVMAVLDGGELSGFVATPNDQFWGGARVQALEVAFRERFGSKHAIAVNSATSGLHCAVAAMGVGPGDEVIVPPYTMSASATVILFTGAVPIFADIEDSTFCLDPAAVEAEITPRTRGIMAVNLFGHPARLAELQVIAKRHSLFLLEDNAQAPGAYCDGRPTGTIGDAGIFSFNRHKTMQCGEGGVVLTDSDRIAQKVALIRNHGEVVVEQMRIDDIVNTAGLNYRMTEMEAAVAGVQFGKLDALNEARVALAARLTQGLSQFPGITTPAVREHCSHVFYFYAMRYDEAQTGIPRDLFCKAMQAEGIPWRAGYVKPLYLEPLYQRKICFGKSGFPFTASSRNADISYQRGLCPTTERLQDREIMLTNAIYPPLTGADIDRVVEAVGKVFAHRDALLAAKFV